jgi:hypothetical protein
MKDLHHRDTETQRRQTAERKKDLELFCLPSLPSSLCLCVSVVKVLLLSILLAGCGGRVAVDLPDDRKFSEIDDLDAEVHALQVLFNLDANPDQLALLAKLAPSTQQPAPPRKDTKVSPAFVKALTGVRDALASFDADAIDAAYKKLDEARAKDDPPFDPIEMTAAARKEAPALLRRFSARQVALYVAGIADFPDPVELLTAAMDDGRQLRGKGWAQRRDEVAFECGGLIGGVEEKAELAARQKATDLLEKAQALDDAEYARQKAALRDEARALLGGLGPTDVIRHHVERALAEALSNHRLAKAVERVGKARKSD